MINYILLAISVSIDSFGIGITYGIKNTKIFILSKIMLFGISLLITTISLCIGNFLSSILTDYLSNIIGSLTIIFLGFWIIYQSLKKKTKTEYNLSKKTYNFIIKSLGITINIIKDPIYSDLDGSRRIDLKESIYLGLALSLDSIGIGICSSIIGLNSFLFPILVASFQIIFLSLGILLGKIISSKINLPKNMWSVVSGVLLIIIGISKLFI